MTLADHLRALLARAACDQQVPVEAAEALRAVGDLERLFDGLLSPGGWSVQDWSIMRDLRNRLTTMGTR